MSFLRYFYIISFIVVTLSFIAAGSYGRLYLQDNIIKGLAENSNIATSEVFFYSIWKKYQKEITLLPCPSNRCSGIKNLYNDLDVFFSKTSVLSLKLHSNDGTTLLSKNKGQATISDGKPIEYLSENNDNHIGFITARNGRIKSNMSFDHNINGKNYSIVKSFFPLYDTSPIDDNSNVIAILEIIYDISPFWEKPIMIQIFIIAAVIATFVIFFAIMYYTSYRSEQLISKQYEDNASLITAKVSAEEENREKSKFLANISHELRTPLNAIIGFSEILKDEVLGPIDNKQYKGYILDINTSGVHLLSLINDILDYSKANAGKLKIDLVEVDVTKLMKNSMRLIESRALEAKVTLKEEVPKEHYILNTDAKRLKQVFLNLLSNSVKFTPEGGFVTMYAWCNVSDNTFIIEVQDTGVGIAPQDISKVMATFGQVENELSRRFEGTGLGLPLSKKLVELMGGKLDIKSELGKGTIVTVILPYDVPKEDVSELAITNIDTDINKNLGLPNSPDIEQNITKPDVSNKLTTDETTKPYISTSKDVDPTIFIPKEPDNDKT